MYGQASAMNSGARRMMPPMNWRPTSDRPFPSGSNRFSPSSPASDRWTWPDEPIPAGARRAMNVADAAALRGDLAREQLRQRGAVGGRQGAAVGSNVISYWPWPISLLIDSTGMPLATNVRHSRPSSSSSRSTR